MKPLPLILLLTSVPAWSQDGVVEPEDDLLRLEARLSVEVWRDSNILLSRADEVDDILTILVPEIEAAIGPDDRFLHLRYTGRDRHFNEHDEFNGMEHVVEARGRYAVGAAWVEAWNLFQDRKDPVSFPVSTARVDWLQEECGGTAGFDSEFVDIEASGRFRRLEVFEASLNVFDHLRWEGSGLVALQLFPDVQLVVEGGMTETEYDDEGVLDDFDGGWVAGGIRGEPLSGVRTLLKVGRFTVDPLQNTGAVASGDDDGLWLSATASVAVGERGTIDVRAFRGPVESILSGWMVVQRFEAGFNVAFGGPLEIRADGWFETADESEGGEDRESHGFRVGATYALGRRVAFSTGWELRARRSDDDTFEYDDRRISAGVTVGW